MPNTKQLSKPSNLFRIPKSKDGLEHPLLEKVDVEIEVDSEDFVVDLEVDSEDLDFVVDSEVDVPRNNFKSDFLHLFF